jgi:hypothetical protein
MKNFTTNWYLYKTQICVRPTLSNNENFRNNVGYKGRKEI